MSDAAQQGDDDQALEEQLREQVEYYRARAPEYDAWANRDGDFDRGELNEIWHAERAQLAKALDAFRPSGEILEIAGGTGQWTEELIRYTALLTVVDAAAEPLEENRKRMARHTKMIAYHHADVFSWDPPDRYDVVFFSFWLSHVPPERFEAFWEQVRRALKPNGRVFFIDNHKSDEAAAFDPETPHGDEVSVLRTAPDGSTYRVWKVLWHPEELEQRLLDLGWEFRVTDTGTFFQWGEGRSTA